MKKASVVLAALALAMFGLAACGGDDDDGNDDSGAAATTEETVAAAGAVVDLSAPADGAFAYEQATASTKAGSVTINFDNPATLSHDESYTRIYAAEALAAIGPAAAKAIPALSSALDDPVPGVRWAACGPTAMTLK